MAIATEAETPAEEKPTFEVLPLSPEVRSAVDALGYVHPTPVQRAVFEPAARGKDLVVQAAPAPARRPRSACRSSTLVQPQGQGRAGADPVPDARAGAAGHPRAGSARQAHAASRCCPYTAARRWAADRGLRRTARRFWSARPAACSTTCAAGRSTPARSACSSSTSATRCCRWASCRRSPRSGRAAEGAASAAVQRHAAAGPCARGRHAPREPEFITLSGDHVGALEIEHYVYMSRGDKTAGAGPHHRESRLRRARSSSATRATRPSASPPGCSAAVTTPTG